jgi:hypothetical protein
VIVGIVLDGEPVKFADVPVEVFPPELMIAMQPSHRPGVHLTDLTICPHRAVLNRKYEAYLPIDSIYRIVRGKAWDCLAGAYKRENTLYQQEFVRDINGIDIVGTPDLVDLTLRTIEDYKAPVKMVTIVNPGYELQVNGYYWLTYPHLPIKIARLYLNFVGPSKAQRIEVPKKHVSVVYDTLAPRLETFMSLMEQDEIGPCGDPDCVYCRYNSREILVRSERAA